MPPGYEFLLMSPEAVKFLLGSLAVVSTALVTYLVARLRAAGERYRDQTARLVAISEQARNDLVTIEEQSRKNQELELQLQSMKAIVAHARAAARNAIILTSPAPATIETSPVDRSQQESQQGQQQLQYHCPSGRLEQQAA